MEKAYLVLVDGWGMELEKLTHFLFSDERLLKISCRKTESLRIESACAELAYLVAQKTVFGEIKKNLYFYGENNKPYFIDEKYGCLSFSHASSVGACLISPVRCGCDIEEKEREVSRIEKKIRFSEGGEEEDSLTLWCVKESCVKLTGEGISKPFSELFFKDGFVSDKNGKCLAKAETGKIGRVIWAVAFEKETSLQVVHLSAREAVECCSTIAK